MSNEQGTNSHLVQGITLFTDPYLELGKCFYTKNLDKLPKFLLEGCFQRLGTLIYFWILTREYDSTVSLSTSYVQSHRIWEQNWVSASLRSWKSSDGREGQAGRRPSGIRSLHHFVMSLMAGHLQSSTADHYAHLSFPLIASVSAQGQAPVRSVYMCLARYKVVLTDLRYHFTEQAFIVHAELGYHSKVVWFEFRCHLSKSGSSLAPGMTSHGSRALDQVPLLKLHFLLGVGGLSHLYSWSEQNLSLQKSSQSPLHIKFTSHSTSTPCLKVSIP